MSYDDTSGRDAVAVLIKGIHNSGPARLDEATIQKRDTGPRRLSRAKAAELAKSGIFIKATSGVEVERPVTRAPNGVASNSVDAIAKALARPAGKLHDLHKDWRDSTMSEPDLPSQSDNSRWDDVRADDGAQLASDRQRGEYGSGGEVKASQAAPSQSSYLRNVSQGPQDCDIETFKFLLSPASAKRIDPQNGFQS